MTATGAMFSIRGEGGADVVEFSVRDLVDEAQIRQAGDEIYRHLKQKEQIRLVVDFHRVEHLSSAVLGVIVALDKVIKQRDGQLRLAGIQDEVFQIFKITKLHKLIKVCADTQTAIASFK